MTKFMKESCIWGLEQEGMAAAPPHHTFQCLAKTAQWDDHCVNARSLSVTFVLLAVIPSPEQNLA